MSLDDGFANLLDRRLAPIEVALQRLHELLDVRLRSDTGDQQAVIRLTNWSSRTVARRRRDGTLPAKKIGGRWLYDLAALRVLPASAGAPAAASMAATAARAR